MPVIKTIEWYILLELLHTMAIVEEDEAFLLKFYSTEFKDVEYTPEGSLIHDPLWIASYILLPASTIAQMLSKEYERRSGFSDSNANPCKRRVEYDTKRKLIRFFINLITNHGLDMGMGNVAAEEINTIIEKGKNLTKNIQPCGIMCLLLVNFPCFVQEFLDQQTDFWNDYPQQIVSEKERTGKKQRLSLAEDMPWLDVAEGDENAVENEVLIDTREIRGTKQYRLFPITKTTGTMEKDLEIEHILPKMLRDIDFLKKLIMAENHYAKLIYCKRTGKEIEPDWENKVTMIIRRCDGNPEYSNKLLPKPEHNGVPLRDDRSSENFHEIKKNNKNRLDAIGMSFDYFLQLIKKEEDKKNKEKDKGKKKGKQKKDNDEDDDQEEEEEENEEEETAEEDHQQQQQQQHVQQQEQQQAQQHELSVVQQQQQQQHTSQDEPEQQQGNDPTSTIITQEQPPEENTDEFDHNLTQAKISEQTDSGDAILKQPKKKKNKRKARKKRKKLQVKKEKGLKKSKKL